MNDSAQRVVGLLVLLAAGILSLPVVAYFIDGQGSENWIVPVQIVVMALIGALVGRLLPGIAGPNATPNKAMIRGALLGVLMAVVGILIFFLLLNGFSGA